MVGSLERHVTLDLEKGGVQARICARQGDALIHKITVALTSGGKKYIPNGAQLAQVYALLPDGSSVSADCRIGADGTVSFTPGGGFFAAGGPVLCRLALRGGDGGEMYSPAFAIDADPCFAAGAPFVPAEEYSRLEELLLKTLASQSICEALAEDIRSGDYSTPLADSLPLMNGEAAAGTADEASRADHVHPTDTTRMPAASEMSSTSNVISTDSLLVHIRADNATKKMMLGRFFAILKESLTSEEWTFVMKDGSTVTKEVFIK